ncbi:response regulator [bacterium]|nr:response regulator [bacterium]
MSGRILIIDDEAEIRRNLTVGLMQEGYSCTACPDGISAIHELYQSREQGQGYDYLITDIFMPDIDGLKILKVIKSEFPNLPVLVITGFGNETLEMTALSEYNTGFLDKPFEISDIVKAIKELRPDQKTDNPKVAIDKGSAEDIRFSVSSYLTLRIHDKDKDVQILNKLNEMKGVVSCDAVHGDVDIILLVHATSEEGLQNVYDNIKAVDGINIVSLSPVERVKLDRDVGEFIEIYKKAVKEAVQKDMPKFSGTKSYVIVDIDKDSLQQVFATLFFLDEVVFCDVVDDVSRLIGIINESGAVGKTSRIIEKLSQINGVLRVNSAKIIKILEN